MKITKNKLFIMSGVLLSICSLLQLYFAMLFISDGHLYNSVHFLLFAVGFAFAAILLLMGRNDKLLGIALCVPIVAQLISLITYSRSDIIIKILFILPFALLIYSVFTTDKTKLSKLLPVYILLPVFLFVLCMIFENVVYKYEYYYTNDYCYEINYQAFFHYLTLFTGLIFTGLSILNIDITKDEKTKEKFTQLSKIGLIGSLCLFVGIILSISNIIISKLIYGDVFFFEESFIIGFIWVVAIVVFLFGMVSMPLFFISPPYRKQMQDSQPKVMEDGYIDMAKHVLLCLFTFGIWQYIWIYRTTAYLNRTPNAEKYDPGTKLLLCIFVPFYSVYWIYKHGQKIDTLSKAKNPKHSDIATLCLVLGIFIPLIAYIIMQEKINIIAKNKDEEVTDTQENSFKQLEEIKQLKELLDTGVITQEEFDTRKKQLLFG